MKEELRKDLERFGRVEIDSATWVHPWVDYWRLYCGKHRDLLIKILSRKYPAYTFHKGESVIHPKIYEVIIIEKKEN